MFGRRPKRFPLCAAPRWPAVAFLPKCSAILWVPAVLAFLMPACDGPLTLRDVGVSAIVYMLTIAPFPLSLLVSGGSRVAQEFFLWQLLRRANHDAGFYLTVVPSIGIPLVALAMAGLVVALRRRQGLDVLIVSLTVVVGAFFEAWPVKGFQYLIPLATPVALPAGDGVWSGPG